MKSLVKRSSPDFSLEDSCDGLACGIDEAGRGPLVGPVLAACVHVPAAARGEAFWSSVTDSKKLTAKKRESLYGLIRQHSFFGIAEASIEEIDSLNIHHATLLAMKRAFEAMCRDFNLEPQQALIDGKFGPDLPCAVTTVIKGDSISLSIAAASILAKVTRDRIMRDLHAVHPHYQWAKNAGYGTPEHLRALAEHGPTPHHRRSFAPLRSISTSSS